MAARERIDSLIDVRKIQDEIRQATAELQTLLDKIEKVADAGASIKFEGFDNAKTMRDMAAATASLEKAMKEVEDLTNKFNRVNKEKLELERQLVELNKQQATATKETATATNQGLQAQQKSVAAIYQEVKLNRELQQTIDDVLGTREQNIKRLAQEQAVLKETNAAIRDNEKAYKSGLKGTGEYLATQERLLDTQNRLKVSIAELNQSIKQDEKIQQAAGNTAAQQSLVLEKLRKAYRNLTEEQKDNASIGGELQRQISELDSALKASDASLGNFQRNVGDYAIAGKSIKAELREITDQLVEMRLAGLDGTEAFAELSEKAGALKDAIMDTTAEIKVMASDTHDLDQLVSVAEGLTGAFTAVKGASALLGSENEELMQTFVKLQAAMAVLNGLKSVQNMLQRQSAAYIMAENMQRKLSVLLIAAQNKAETGGIVTRKLATVAQKALNKAMAANPAGLLLTALTALIGVGYTLYKVFSSNAEIQKTYAAAIDNTRRSVDNLNRDLERQVKFMQAEGASQTAIIRERISAANEEYNRLDTTIRELSKNILKLSKEQRQQLKELVDQQRDVNNKITDLNDDLYVANLNQQNEAQKQRLDNMRDGMSKELALMNLDYKNKLKAAEGNAELTAALLAGQAKAEQEIRKKYAEQFIKNERDIMNKLAESRINLMAEGFEKELAQLRMQSQSRIDELRDRLKNELNLTKTQREAINETINNLIKKQAEDEEKLIVNAQITANKKQIELINIRLEAVRKGSEDEFELRTRMLNLQREIEIAEAEKTGLDVKAIRDKYDKLQADESIAFLQSRIDRQSRETLLSIDRQENIELVSLRERLEKREITEIEYQERLDEITFKHNIKRAEIAVQNARKELDAVKAAGGDTLAAEEKLTAAQIALDNAKAENFVQNRDKEKQAQEQLNQKLQELGQELFNTSQAFTQAAFKSRMDSLKEVEEADKEAKERELEQAEGNKQLIDAINQKYADRDKQRDKERRKLEAEQARQAKTAALFQIAINTAQAISKIWAEVPKGDFGVSTIALTAAATLMGALQAAAVAAQPLPKYWTGRERGRDEWAIVGDRGIEAIEHPGGQLFLTPEKPTIAHLPSWARVISNPELMQMMEGSAGQTMTEVPIFDLRELKAEFVNLRNSFVILADTVKNKKEFHLNITERGMWKTVKSGNSYQEYLNRNVRI